MSLMAAALLALALIAATAGLLLLGQYRRNLELKTQLEAAGNDLQRLQKSCERLAPGNVVDRLLTDGAEATAERREATALFADIVGYTAMSERLEPPQLARVLNGYFEAMSEAITTHRGHISTFVGDGILAYFGALEPNPWQCNDAAQAALAMRENLTQYNAVLEAEGLPALAIGIGLHRGPGLAGMVGTPERMEYAFVGRTVNLAARVQSLTRIHVVDILVTDTVRDQLDPAFELRQMPAESVKGIEQPVVTYALIGYNGKGARGNDKPTA